jgi:hypothetical protein
VLQASDGGRAIKNPAGLAAGGVVIFDPIAQQWVSASRGCVTWLFRELVTEPVVLRNP